MKAVSPNKKSRNASASAFGWDFQINAGIMLMVMNMPQAEMVKIEGEKEDIEITLADKSKIFAQAKSSVNPIDCKDVKDKLSAALETLTDASIDENVSSLIYVTNIPNACNHKNSISLFSYAPTFREYCSLPEGCKKQVKDILTKCNLRLPLEKLSIFVFAFCGDGDARYAHVKQRIFEFLDSLDSKLVGMGQRILERWRLDLGKNASQNDRTMQISKKQMIWPLIVWCCENSATQRLDNLDVADRVEVLKRYEGVIKTNAERFELFTQVINAYDLYLSNNHESSKEATEKFINSESEKFRDEFDFSETSDKVASFVLRLTIERIIETRYTVRCITQKVRL